MLGTAQCHNINKSKPNFHKNVLGTGKLQQGDLIFIDQYFLRQRVKILILEEKNMIMRCIMIVLFVLILLQVL